jgi:two-component system, cell cycle response regulator DivK
MSSLDVHEHEHSFIPWLAAGSSRDNNDTKKTPARAELPVDSPAITILVVDDDAANLALAEALLQAEGFSVCVARDFASMFEVLKTCTPALILMDIQLPEVDGWELTRQLKADAATRDIPVIAVTAYGKVGDDQKARDAGFVEFLSKPVSTRELPGIVRRHLAGR